MFHNKLCHWLVVVLARTLRFQCSLIGAQHLPQLSQLDFCAKLTGHMVGLKICVNSFLYT